MATTTRVLYMSGYTDDMIVRHRVAAAETTMVEKPFSPAVLAAKVREVLDAPRASA
jgi:DNA-binding response OmpR family regulator